MAAEIRLKAFKAYDVRGVWDKDINSDLVFKAGYFLPELLGATTILVGRDCRISSDEVFQALTDGIRSAGASVHDAGLCTTPMIYWATAKYAYKASVMITASHNPSQYNGLKISADNALPVGYDNGLNKLEKKIIEGKMDVKPTKGLVEKVHFHGDYLDFLRTYRPKDNSLKISLDCSNGMASMFVKELFPEHTKYLNDILDGNFPGHEPNPLESENREPLRRHLLQNKSDLGIIFDGDADRVMFLDELGNFVSPDLIIALLGHYFFGSRKEHGLVLQDIRSSRAVGEYLGKNFGASVQTWRVGRAYGAGKLREIDGLFGGELAGHYYFRDFYYSDSGLMAALIVLDLLEQFKLKGITLSQLISSISSYHNSGEINFKVEHKELAMKLVAEHFKATATPLTMLDFDGIRLDFEDWWFNIRPSNTEPYLRFIAEAVNPEKLEWVVSETRAIIENLNATPHNS